MVSGLGYMLSELQNLKITASELALIKHSKEERGYTPSMSLTIENAEGGTRIKRNLAGKDKRS
jgi:hypothetical protein